MAQTEETPTSPFDEAVCFKDRKRKIDFVLVYKTSKNQSKDEINEDRDVFQEKLKEDGLQWEKDEVPCEKKTGTTDETLNFVKIHAPMEVLLRYAEIMKLKMPMKQQGSVEQKADVKEGGKSNDHKPEEDSPKYNRICCIFNEIKKTFDTYEKEEQPITTEYQKTKADLGLFDDPEKFFMASERSRVVDFILKKFSINNLLAKKVYTAAYPLHEALDENNTRSALNKEWASLYNIHKRQPLEDIKNYFGEKVGLYFAWLGFYTYMLIPASAMGLICFIYGFATMYTYVPCKEICDKTSNIVMCPSCDNCSFWKLNEACKQYRITHVIDNPAMLIYAVLMSFWAALYFELWKRYSAEIKKNWDLSDFDRSEEQPRPEYLAMLEKNKKDTKKEENNPDNTKERISFWKQRFPAVIVSASVSLLLASVAVIAVIGVIVYRMSIYAILSLGNENQDKGLIERNAPMITSASAALINLVCIVLLNPVYARVAEKLTALETPRTQSDYDDSLTLKLFLMEFVNYYTSLFYIAFFKGRIAGYPGNYRRLFGFRQEECPPGGCLMELGIQLSVIMIGKQAGKIILKLVLPFFTVVGKRENLRKALKSAKARMKGNWEVKKTSRWEEDYSLFDSGSHGLFSEYLEMVLQFGFVTIFVTAFPLAPLCALINNCYEIRTDAKKFLILYRRQVAQRVPSIGVWYRILDCMGKLSVLINACIIAFTSNVIPRLVYYFTIGNNTLVGQVNHSLSYFYVNDSETLKTLSNFGNYCRYEGYREYPDPLENNHEYKLTHEFWLLLAMRLAFVLVFENVVMLPVTMLRWLVPDVPKAVKDKIKEELKLINKIEEEGKEKVVSLA